MMHRFKLREIKKFLVDIIITFLNKDHIVSNTLLQLSFLKKSIFNKNEGDFFYSTCKDVVF